MTPYGKTAQNAIAALSRLAQVYDAKGGARLSSGDIARARNLPQPLVAKILTILSQAGLITGAPGPGGGYALARPPGQVTLREVARLFERPEEELGCPFGPGWCGTGPQCPLHEQLQALRERFQDFLGSNTLALFVGTEAQHPPPAPAGGLALPMVSVRPPA